MWGDWGCGNWRRALEEAEGVVHLAWYSSVGNRHPEIQSRCVEDTRELVAMMLPHQHLIFPSSCSVYGDVGGRLCTEKDECQPGCAYTRAKRLAELCLSTVSTIYKTTVFRFGSLMGLGVTRTKTELVVNSMAVEGWQKGVVEVWNPDSYKPIIHVTDAARVICQALKHEWLGTYNACGSCFTAIDIASAVRSITDAQIILVKDRNGPRSCQMNCDKLRDLMEGVGKPLTTGYLYDTIHELRDYHPTELDRNDPQRWSQVEICLPAG
jgi:nucleoside-diphosphate-sugar epimerase